MLKCDGQTDRRTDRREGGNSGLDYRISAIIRRLRLDYNAFVFEIVVYA